MVFDGGQALFMCMGDVVILGTFPFVYVHVSLPHKVLEINLLLKHNTSRGSHCGQKV